jgi:hypothetical protein
MAGKNQDRLVQATRAALNAFLRLEQDFKVYFNKREIEIVVHDRMLVPNTEETRAGGPAGARWVFPSVFGRIRILRELPTEPRKLFGVTVVAEREFSLQELSANLGSSTT